MQPWSDYEYNVAVLKEFTSSYNELEYTMIGSYIRTGQSGMYFENLNGVTFVAIASCLLFKSRGGYKT